MLLQMFSLLVYIPMLDKSGFFEYTWLGTQKRICILMFDMTVQM